MDRKCSDYIAGSVEIKQSLFSPTAPTGIISLEQLLPGFFNGVRTSILTDAYRKNDETAF